MSGRKRTGREHKERFGDKNSNNESRKPFKKHLGGTSSSSARISRISAEGKKRKTGQEAGKKGLGSLDFENARGEI